MVVSATLFNGLVLLTYFRQQDLKIQLGASMKAIYVCFVCCCFLVLVLVVVLAVAVNVVVVVVVVAACFVFVVVAIVDDVDLLLRVPVLVVWFGQIACDARFSVSTCVAVLCL